MIAYLKGEIADLTEDNVVIEVNQIGYNVKISAATASLLPSLGESVKIYTYTNVREDAIQLFGFLTKDDLEMFQKVITVNGIGPKGGLAILSVMSSDDLRFAILSGDAKAISKAPGIGSKTAERLILDLRDKVSLEDAFSEEKKNMTGVLPGKDNNPAKTEAIEALTALGYPASDALKAVKQIEINETMTVEDILKQALKKISLL